MSIIKYFFTLFLFTTLTISTSLAAEKRTVLFEGYSKVQSAGVQVGYIVNRYEFDPTLKRFYSTSFLKTGQLGSDITESLQAEGDEKFGPIRYQYTSIMGKEIKTIDAKFNRTTVKPAKNSKEAPKIKIQMVAIVKEGKNIKTIKKDIPEGTFLSTFLIYLMLQSKDGIQTNANYKYSAVAEEDADIQIGEARVDQQTKFSGVDTFKITNSFKNVSFTSYVTDKGEVIGTRSPAVSIATDLVAKSNEALGSMTLPTSTLKTLFGEVPTGEENILARRSAAEAKPVVIPANPKQEGVPQNQGIILKGGAPVPPPKSEGK